MNDEQKALKRQYLESPPAMGIFQIRNMANDKVLISQSLNLPGSLNRHRLQLQLGSHPNRALQSDWNEFGAAQFVFEILDELTLRDEPTEERRAEVAALETIWLEQVRPYGERGYNEPQKSREERLQMIMRNRSSQANNSDGSFDD